LKNKQVKFGCILFYLMITLGLITPLHSFAQEQLPGNIKISITFTAAPTNVNPQFTYLKYNKAFALILQADDATSDVYNKVYPLFAGQNGNPGLFMTDGTGNNVPFSMEVNHFTLKSGKDVHETDTTNYNIDFKYDTVCFGDSTTLINVSTGKDSLLQVSWDLNMDGKFDDATGDTVIYAFPKSGTWLVGMRLSYQSGNIKLKEHQVPVGDKPVVDFTYSGLCSAEGNTLFTDSTKLAFGDITTRYWDYGDGISEYRPNIYAYHQYYPGNYTAKLIVTTSYGCVDSLSKSFTIYGTPDIVVQRKDSSQVFYNDTVKFRQGDSAYLAIANPANYDSIIWPPHILSPDFYLKEPGKYEVKAYQNICPGASVFYGAYNGGPTPITSAHVMPFFTPNGDGYNDKWVVNNKEIVSPIKLRIYNRAGSLVYSSDNYNNDWQGENNGNPLPKGTYYYVIIDNTGKKFTGAVSIIR